MSAAYYAEQAAAQAGVDPALVQKVQEGIESRLTWASMHWGVERVHPDAWPHIAAAAVKALAAEGGAS